MNLHLTLEILIFIGILKINFNNFFKKCCKRENYNISRQSVANPNFMIWQPRSLVVRMPWLWTRIWMCGGWGTPVLSTSLVYVYSLRDASKGQVYYIQKLGLTSFRGHATMWAVFARAYINLKISHFIIFNEILIFVKLKQVLKLTAFWKF